MTAQAARPMAPDLEAAKLYRRIPAARRRAEDARAKADKRPTAENLDAAADLQAGLERLEAQYRAAKAEAQP